MVKDVQVQDKWTKLAFEVDNIIVKAVAENSLNPGTLRKSLRQVCYHCCLRPAGKLVPE